MDFYTGLYYFLLGFVPPAVLVIGMASFEAGNVARLGSLFVGLAALMIADYKIISLAMPRATTTSDHIIVISSIYYQPEVAAFGIGLTTLFGIWFCHIAYIKLFTDKPRAE